MNNYTVNGNITAVHLKYGKDLIINTADLDKVLDHRWYLVMVRKRMYAASNMIIKGKATIVNAHRFLHKGHGKDKVTTVDGDALNCTRANLTLLKKKPRYAEYACSICGTLKTARVDSIRAGKNKCCSQECGNESRRRGVAKRMEAKKALASKD